MQRREERSEHDAETAVDLEARTVRRRVERGQERLRIVRQQRADRSPVVLVGKPGRGHEDLEIIDRGPERRIQQVRVPREVGDDGHPGHDDPVDFDGGAWRCVGGVEVRLQSRGERNRATVRPAGRVGHGFDVQPAVPEPAETNRQRDAFDVQSAAAGQLQDDAIEQHFGRTDRTDGYVPDLDAAVTHGGACDAECDGIAIQVDDQCRCRDQQQ
jgi:hypothetical protein